MFCFELRISSNRLPFVQYGKIYGYVYWRFSLYDVEGGGCGGGCGCGAVSGGHFEQTSEKIDLLYIAHDVCVLKKTLVGVVYKRQIACVLFLVLQSETCVNKIHHISLGERRNENIYASQHICSLQRLFQLISAVCLICMIPSLFQNFSLLGLL